jgi:hypothetical protein
MKNVLLSVLILFSLSATSYANADAVQACTNLSNSEGSGILGTVCTAENSAYNLATNAVNRDRARGDAASLANDMVNVKQFADSLMGCNSKFIRACIAAVNDSSN